MFIYLQKKNIEICFTLEWEFPTAFEVEQIQSFYIDGRKRWRKERGELCNNIARIAVEN